ncbi:hypothetical protein [Desulfofustis glycolicus]|uniref:MazG nucleotide pyrophosphohydrolase domain-containing protein n=1 Tax=Desulfofustis glycolicus DSM 9705 TaxID=1121409 RepID=A0A1M5S5Q8_9BACT|nr:hypothetical protein [Desulfofustis glycolicus]SHH33937.1 hypothetical protein SAMN02745124_00180 [Desulfofustis glycolicus DSM 9705]
MSLADKMAEATYGAMELIVDELQAAEEKHPGWPSDPIHGTAIMVEEAGKATQAAIDCIYSDGDVERLRRMLARTGAMAVRALVNLEPAEQADNN